MTNPLTEDAQYLLDVLSEGVEYSAQDAITLTGWDAPRVYRALAELAYYGNVTNAPSQPTVH